MGKRRLILRMLWVLLLVAGFGLVDNCSAREKENKWFSWRAKGKATVKKGNKVKVKYKGSLEDGTVFDQSKRGAPLEFTVGSGKVIPGFDQAVEGMQLNEIKRVSIKANQAYGKRNKNLIKEFTRADFPANFNPQKGMVLRLQDSKGRPVPGTIVDVKGDRVSVDANHPLAGKDLIFDITVVGIEEQ